MNASVCIVLCVLLWLPAGNANTPADCTILSNVIPQCDCQGSTSGTNDIVIRCRNLAGVPQINGNYSGLIHEFSLKDNNNIEQLPAHTFQGLRIKNLNLYGTRLKNVSDDALVDLFNDLEELSISGDDASDVLPPMAAIRPLRKLKTLHIHRFKPANHNLEGEHLFSFSSLQQLNLEKMKLRSIASNVFYLPKVTTLRLVDNLFTSFPSDAIHTLSSLQYLTVTDSQITNIPGYFFDRIRKVVFFDVSRNQISLLDDDCFIHITDVLETLILNQNPLSTATKLSRISDIRSLKELRLQNIGLQEITSNPEFLRNKNQLKYLHLQGNRLTRLNGNEFVSVAGSLNVLDLSYNQIMSIASTTFSGMSSLTYLNLEDQTTAGNVLLPSFGSLSALEKLSLQLTKLDTTNAWQQIKHLTNLAVLNLDNTGLTHIPDFVFSDATKLAELSLSNNDITNLTQEMFFGLRDSVKSIYLNDNKIKTLHPCTFYTFTRMLTLSLANNPLHCDCHLKWLKERVNSGSISFGSLTPTEKCSSPSLNQGKYFMNVPVNDFVCNVHVDDPVCPDYYASTTLPASTTPPASVSSTLPAIDVSLSIVETTINTIKIKYSVSDIQHVERINIQYTNLKTQAMKEETLAKIETVKTIYGLQANTRYEVCIRARKTDNTVTSDCKTYGTKPDPSATTIDPIPSSKTGDDTGLIVGASIGGVVLLCLLVAILYLLFIKRSTKNKKLPSEKVVATTAALPRIGYDSKHFKKKKRPNGNNNTRSPEEIQVSVISDGQGSDPNLGRMSAGSYQFLDENAPSKVSHKPNMDAMYMNGTDSRPLPVTPDKKHHSYENEGFQRSPSESENTYSEIRT